VTSEADIARAMDGITHVYHLAGFVSRKPEDAHLMKHRALLAPPRDVVATTRHRSSARATLRSVRDPPSPTRQQELFPNS
jgi:hypothetical protein